MIPTINLQDFTYDLPDERIARFPVEPRDSSKLLLYKNGQISEQKFTEISALLPPKSFLVFNNTKVIPARLYFQKEGGATIEIFLLNPVEPSNVISQVMENTQTCTWACMIGNKKRWKKGILSGKIANEKWQIDAELLDTEQNLVKFSWTSGHSFAEIVKAFGEIPLPPYLKRKTELKDLDTYQTVYSKHDGAVAAPTAGLHFTETIFNDLATNDIKHDFLTLHVGAGTFQPIKVTNITEHKMHSEQIVFRKSLIVNLLESIDAIIPVGTTSMRSLESLYWFGVKLLRNEFKVQGSELKVQAPFFIEKLYPYQETQIPNPQSPIPNHESLNAVLQYMEQNGLEEIIGETEIFIFPSYQFRLCKGIITNFHQPDSTLILLVAALVGTDWRRIYDFAMTNNFRFLSYGDSSLLLP